MTIRNMTIEDYSGAFSLWRKTPGVYTLKIDDSRGRIEKLINSNRENCFVAEDKGKIIGTILCGCDGRWGTIYHLCVDVRYRNKGIGKSLLKSVTRQLEIMNVTRVNLIAWKNNVLGNRFWENNGFVCRDDVNYYNYLINKENIFE